VSGKNPEAARYAGIIVAWLAWLARLHPTGLLFAERSGVLNLGVEGMMLMGALAGFAAAQDAQDLATGVCAAMLVGGLLTLLHAVFVISLRANQVVCGLALTILGPACPASWDGR
jgi:simple sugar transport system permease protein